MARKCNWRDFSRILEAGKYWREHALAGYGSIFTNDPIWSDENLDKLNQYFVKNLDWGEGSFLTKLESQLSAAGTGANKLAAEMLWLMHLCPSNIKPHTKRDLISKVWGYSGEVLSLDSEWLQDDVLVGVGSSGTAYNTNRWRELVFFINFMREFRAEPEVVRERLLSDGWELAEWMQKIEEANTRQLRPMLLFLLFPDEFERIFGGTDRRAILAAFEGNDLKEVNKLSALEIDRKIAEIRADYQSKNPSTPLDFYDEPLKAVWKTAAGPEAIKSINNDHVLSALSKIDSDGIPEDAKSTFYDLVYEGRRYPPKYVLSLAGEYANGIKLDRGLFSGGESSKAFRHLRKLGFHIEEKNALVTIVRNFLEQADEGTNLGVSSYLNKYNDLNVSVSFGKGNFAKVPWIAFTGYGQTVQQGIYPVLLYYKSSGLLVLAYGKSETHPVDFDWPNLDKDQAISRVLQDKYDIKPERYGSSYVRAIYKLPDDIDLYEVSSDVDQLISEYKAFMEGIKDPSPHPELEIEPYSIEEALDELFIEPEIFDSMLSLLKRKKNIIVQGPPGVGKTFVCKRLAYALMGERADGRIAMIQFHQTYSYEDFVQGFRPSGDGFNLKDGIFYQFAAKASQDLSNDYVFIIDEINRGNLSKIFGELMMLIEADKRGPDWSIPLAYGYDLKDTFSVPENLFLIGLMNTADRSLAMVDYALRRRFGFFDLKPGFHTEQFYDHLLNLGAEPKFIESVQKRLAVLNKRIAEDKSNLGAGFCVGHSFFASVAEGEIPNPGWFNRIVEYEIAPLIREYWFDNEETADSIIQDLLTSK